MTTTSPQPDAQARPHRARLPWTGTGAVIDPDLDRAAAGARVLLEALGVDLDNESLARTPERMASSLAELMSPRPFQMTARSSCRGWAW